MEAANVVQGVVNRSKSDRVCGDCMHAQLFAIEDRLHCHDSQSALTGRTLPTSMEACERFAPDTRTLDLASYRQSTRGGFLRRHEWGRDAA